MCNERGSENRCRAARWRLGLCVTIALLLCAQTGFAAQSWRNKRVFFGDTHWHSCLSQDGHVTMTSQYESMFYDYGLDFSLESDHAEGAEAGISGCDTYLPSLLINYPGEFIASAMKKAADDWNGRELQTPAQGILRFVTFPGYEWAPEARCWQRFLDNLLPNDLNSDDNTPGHINYFFSNTTGWTYHDDVWQPGDGDSTICAIASLSPWVYFNGSKDWVDELLGQLIHQRDDNLRDFDMLIQYNHPAASIDKGGSSDHLAKWFDFEHSSSQCSVAPGRPPCNELHCEALRRAYGVTNVEWYANHEAAIGSTEQHGNEGEPCTGNLILDAFSERCYHDTYHLPDRWIASRGLREGYMLAANGGSDSHNGRWNDPGGDKPEGDRGAGGRSLTAVYATEAERPAIWDGLSRRHTYALSRKREIGPVHKGRVDFFSPGPPEIGMGDIAEASAAGTTRSFTITAAAEIGSPDDTHPRDVRLYRVGPFTPLATRTDLPNYWLDDLADGSSKFGELIGRAENTGSASEFTYTFANVVVYPGDAIFAVVPYSDDVWYDTHYADDGSRVDADSNGVIDDGKTPMAHGDDNTWARTTPIFFHEVQERGSATGLCSHASFAGTGVTDAGATGGLDGGLAGDTEVLPVGKPGATEWNRWMLSLPVARQLVDVSFWNGKDGDGKGHLFAIRIDGQLLFSGRAVINWPANTLVTLTDIPFPLAAGLHQIDVHMDDQQYANGDNDPDFHCNDYDGPPGFIDSLAFHDNPGGGECGDVTPPQITCPAGILVECSASGGAPASAPALVAFLAGATATDDIDTTPTITNDAPTFFPNGVTTVKFTAKDDAQNEASCSATVTVGDTTAPLLAAFSLAPLSLAPPKHKMVRITVPTLVATDACDPAPRIRCSVTSNEPEEGLGDGDQPIDIIFNGVKFRSQGTGEQQIATTAGRGAFTLELRAERSGTGKGRVYTTRCLGVDAGGNRGLEQLAPVVVPK